VFEQKKAKHYEQKIISSQIQSRELCLDDDNDAIVLLELVSEDTRSQKEIFDSLKNRIIRDSAGKLNESQAIEATRHLLNFFETFFKSSKSTQYAVDKQRVHGNVTDQT
jgi:hypothetical protein